MGKTAVYPGSFDPITNGHIDIIKRGLGIFDNLIILIGFNPNKSSLFSVEERTELIRGVIGDDKRLTVDSYSGLLIDYVKDSEACCILRGLRAMSDFEYEFQLALMNRRLDRRVETVFLMTGSKWFYCNSRIIKEAASLGGSVKGMVPDSVLKKLKVKFPTMKNNN
ncbi:MAG: pantetheine-phosphate adenylyltransferase [Deltaproteobacteria bacterium]|jgi:pantetheine-phosphate adenylyltransferase|nr:pantetheine-phosphate adenylyltransferase [Deltaproteobacteria bacterium]MBN2846815.1 pantetheine-phosphate adenylyltransferase [Deltaproteobacteria bacterium]